MHDSRRRSALLIVTIVAAVGLGGCSTGTDGATTNTLDVAEVSTPDVDQEFPDLVGLSLLPQQDRTFLVTVTVSSPYDSPSRYADGVQLSDQEGNVIIEHKFTHDHADEQPFTRSFEMVIPETVQTLEARVRDSENGYGSATSSIDVPAAAE